MKKLIVTLIVGLMMVGVGSAYASSSVRLLNETYGASAVNEDTSPVVDTRNYKKSSFFINYDETETDGGLQGTFKVEVSFDKDTWFDAPISTLDQRADLQDTPDTSIVMDADAKKIAFFDYKLAAPWMRVKFMPENTDGDDFIYITVDFIGIQ